MLQSGHTAIFELVSRAFCFLKRGTEVCTSNMVSDFDSMSFRENIRKHNVFDSALFREKRNLKGTMFL